MRMGRALSIVVTFTGMYPLYSEDGESSIDSGYIHWHVSAVQ